ncbi:Mn superoxide dismutase [Coprinellus micaceus]|uniref:Superoxide dismutase n=1 Tax=Coprinellus micaceus TaxID=71717 RepID=A0A4Y7SUL5_COPMI|nr:Mn superoxide dismutase [Coprinellus micaceus]
MLAAAVRNTFKPTISRAFAASTRQVRGIQTASLPPLPYPYNALEPYISEEIMTLHHQKHHQTYVNGLNAAEEAYSKSTSVKEQIALQAAIKFNGGGHINHSLFWKNLAPANEDGGKLSDGALKKAIERDFGSVEEFKKQFNTQTAAIQGSGWGWLGYNKKTSKLEVVSTANQDPLISHVPILGVDIWEHAFYLQYKNVKPDYLNAIWNVINFKEAEKRFLEATQ